MKGKENFSNNKMIGDIKMCKKLTVAFSDQIGNKRVGWCCWNGKDYSFISDKTVKARISGGDLVNGFTFWMT